MELKRKKSEKGHVEFAEQMCANYSHSTIKRFIAQRDVHLARVDKPLLVFKMFFFFVYSSMATTFPFLPSYFRQIGFSSYQVQILCWVRPFVQLLLSPLWGLLADHCLPKKIILQFCSFVWLIGTISLAFVEPTGQMCQLVSLNQTDSTVINSTVMQTGFFRRRRATEYFTLQSKLIPKNPVDNLSSNDLVERVEITTGSGSGLLPVTENDILSGSGNGESLDHNKELNDTNVNKNHSFLMSASSHFTASHLGSKSKNLPSIIELNFTIRNELRENTSRLYHIFLGALALVVFEEIFFCPVFFVADAVLLAKQTEEGTCAYGYQKMFGSVGFLMFFLITGTLVNNSQRPVCGHIYADYIINFCFFCVLTIVTLLVLIRFEVPQRTSENSPYERLKTIYYTKHHGTFFASAAFMGFSHTVILNFHSSYLAEAKVAHATLATINLFRFLGEPLALFVSHKLINHIGNINMIFSSLVLYMFNHFACSFVTSCWQIIPLGFVEGFTFGNSFVVCVTYLAHSSPLDCLSTMQGKETVLLIILWITSPNTGTNETNVVTSF